MDAREQAEQIVGDALDDLVQYGRLVAALAAAIQHRRAQRREDEAFGRGDVAAEESALADAAAAAVILDDALSALGANVDPEDDA